MHINLSYNKAKNVVNRTHFSMKKSLVIKLTLWAVSHMLKYNDASSFDDWQLKVQSDFLWRTTYTV